MKNVAPSNTECNLSPIFNVTFEHKEVGPERCLPLYWMSNYAPPPWGYLHT